MTFKIASLAAGAALLSSAAFAADMPVAQPPMDAVVQEAGFDWTGFYVGAYGGFGWGNVDIDDGVSESDSEGGLAGGTVGYNMQSGNFVYGIEADGGWAGIETQDFADDANINLDWTSTVRGRVGYAFDNFMIYATGGAAIAGVEDEFSGDDDTRLGWTAGAGVEASLTEHISAKVEYLYMDLGDDDLGGDPVDIQVHTVKGGINYRF